MIPVAMAVKMLKDLIPWKYVFIALAILAVVGFVYWKINDILRDRYDSGYSAAQTHYENEIGRRAAAHLLELDKMRKHHADQRAAINQKLQKELENHQNEIAAARVDLDNLNRQRLYVDAKTRNTNNCPGGMRADRDSIASTETARVELSESSAAIIRRIVAEKQDVTNQLNELVTRINAQRNLECLRVLE